MSMITMSTTDGLYITHEGLPGYDAHYWTEVHYWDARGGEAVEVSAEEYLAATGGPSWEAPPLLDLAEVAARLGVSYGSIRRYRSMDPTFPAPDVLLGQSPGWLPATIDAWQAARPGRGVGGGRPRRQASGAA